MRRNPEKVAWTVLASAFLVFATIVVALPLGVRWHLLYAQKALKASVASLVGTVVLEPPVGRTSIPLAKGQSMVVAEGTLIRLDEKAEATVGLPDGSLLRLYPGTRLRLVRLSAPRYRMGRLPIQVFIGLADGRIQVGTALATTVALDFRVTTPQTEARLAADGSFALDCTEEHTDLAVYRGQAMALAAGKAVLVEARQRTQVLRDSAPGMPVGIASNLIVNGDFSAPLAQGWRVFDDQGADGGGVPGQAELVIDEGRRAVRFSRSGGHGNHCETIIEQTMDRQLPDQVTSLVVRATVKLAYQSLSGGGYLSSEYPLMVRLTYRDEYDSETEWVQGFYYQNDANNPTMYGMQIPEDRWYFYESGNLLESLPIHPHKIIRVRVYASGWDYESLLSDISLIAE